MATPEPTPRPEEVRAQLERLLGWRELAGSERSRALLRYVVEAALEGRASELKAYTIAVDALGRRAGPDTQAESAVRVEASRLRRKLLHYYLTDGAADPVRIELPPQGYVPIIRYAASAKGAPDEPFSSTVGGGGWKVPAALSVALVAGIAIGFALGYPGRRAEHVLPVEPAAEAPAGLPEGPRIGVSPFTDLTGEPRLALLAEGMAESLVSRLARDPRLVVVARASEAGGGVSALPADYLVEGSLRADPDRIRLSASLVAAADRRIIWREDFDRSRSPASLIAIEDELALAILRAIAQSRGEEIGLPASTLPTSIADLAAFECVLEAAAYRRRKTPELHRLVRDCLERAVIDEPGYAAAWAGLALVYLDEHFLRFNPRDEPVARAARASGRAMALDPAAGLSHRAALGVAFARGELEAFRAAAARGLALEPRNPELLAFYAEKLGWLGEWPEARRTILRAFLLDHDPPDWYRHVLVLDAYHRGAWLDALAHLLAMRDRPGLEATYLRAIVLARLGDAPGARDALRRARELAPALVDTVAEDLERRHVPAEARARILEDLRSIGEP